MAGREYRNQIDWLTPALALTLWAAHFSLLWAASSIFPDHPAARWIAAALTLVAAVILLWIWRKARPPIFSVPGLGIGISAVGILFNVMPAIVG